MRTETRKHDCVAGNYNPSFKWSANCMSGEVDKGKFKKDMPRNSPYPGEGECRGRCEREAQGSSCAPGKQVPS